MYMYNCTARWCQILHTVPANELGFHLHLVRSTLLETAAPVC